jgi:hypothetical protein
MFGHGSLQSNKVNTETRTNVKISNPPKIQQQCTTKFHKEKIFRILKKFLCFHIKKVKSTSDTERERVEYTESKSHIITELRHIRIHASFMPSEKHVDFLKNPYT